RVVDDVLRQLHDGDVDLVEAGRPVVDCDPDDGLAEVLSEDLAVLEAAVARAEPPRRGQRDELVATEVHARLDRFDEPTPGREDVRPVAECALVVRTHEAGSRYRSVLR